MEASNLIRRLRLDGWECYGGDVYAKGAWELDIRQSAIYATHCSGPAAGWVTKKIELNEIPPHLRLDDLLQLLY